MRGGETEVSPPPLLLSVPAVHPSLARGLTYKQPWYRRVAVVSETAGKTFNDANAEAGRRGR